MRARLRRWIGKALDFLAESGSAYYYTGNPADPYWPGDKPAATVAKDDEVPPGHYLP